MACIPPFERSYGGRQLSPLSPRAQVPFAWDRRAAVSISWSPASWCMPGGCANVPRTLVNHILVPTARAEGGVGCIPPFERSYGGRQLSSLSPRAQLPFAWGRRPAVFVSWSPASCCMRSGYANVPRTLVNHTLGQSGPSVPLSLFPVSSSPSLLLSPLSHSPLQRPTSLGAL